VSFLGDSQGSSQRRGLRLFPRHAPQKGKSSDQEEWEEKEEEEPSQFGQQVVKKSLPFRRSLIETHCCGWMARRDKGREAARDDRNKKEKKNSTRPTTINACFLFRSLFHITTHSLPNQ
jgi:hypothetical protein